jgi:hypothetical protein
MRARVIGSLKGDRAGLADPYGRNVKEGRLKTLPLCPLNSPSARSGLLQASASHEIVEELSVGGFSLRSVDFVEASPAIDYRARRTNYDAQPVGICDPPLRWKGFWVHIATIVVGLFIAVCIDKTVEAIHQHFERVDSRGSIQAGESVPGPDLDRLTAADLKEYRATVSTLAKSYDVMIERIRLFDFEANEILAGVPSEKALIGRMREVWGRQGRDPVPVP